MFTKLSDLLEKYAKGWIILLFLALEVIFNAVVLPRTQSQLEAGSAGTGPIDLQFFYSPEKAFSMIESYSEATRASYRVFELTGDILYPIVYTLFFSLLITWLFKRGFAADSRLQRLNVVPFGAWLFDLLENLSIVTLLSLYPARPIPLAWLSTIFTMIKWTFAGASILLVVTGFVMALKKRF